jgi:HlyD family secretion protein
MNNRDLLRDFTHKRNLAQLESDVSQTEMALERSIRKAKADVVQAKANLNAREAENNRQKDKLQKTLDQLSKAKIYAPINGRVIYASSVERNPYRGNDEPLDEGQTVRERQKLIYLPTADSVNAEVDVHESNMRSIKPGLLALITLDAMPGKKYQGEVATISPLPDATRAWLNPDLKVYNTDIHITENGSELRTGMSCKVEIIIEKYKDVIYIPVQAVLKIGREDTVYVVKDNTIEPRKVKIGLDNNRMIRIIEGLEEGELVSLAPPLSSAEVTTEDSFAEDKTDETKTADQKAKKKDDPKQKPAGNISPEDMKKMKEKFQNASPEEKEKMRQGMRKNSGGQRQQRGPAK